MTSRMADCWEYAEGRRARELSLDEVVCPDASAPPDRFVWIRLHEPDEECLEVVQKKVDLHELAVEDAHRAHQRPKLERYGETLFLVVRTVEPHADRSRLVFGEAHAFLGPGYLVTVRHGPHYHDVVVPRVEARADLLCYGPGFALYSLLDFIVDSYAPVAIDLEGELDEIEEEVFGSSHMRRHTTARLYELKRDLLTGKRAVYPLVDITKKLSEQVIESITDEARAYFRDVHDHVVRLAETLDSLSELHRGILEANLSLMSFRQNEVMKKLAGWAAILAIPTMLGGIFGMNFTAIPGLAWKWGFAATIAAMVALAALLYGGLRRADWL
jgi:magnesium transporter